MIKNFNVISSDVGKINNQYFINVAAAGMFSDISFVVSKEEKKTMLKNWKETQHRDYILTKAEAEKLLDYLDQILENTPCDNTLRFTKQWLQNNIPAEKFEGVLAEMRTMGGYCDCEVLMNCYEEYDLD